MTLLSDSVLAAQAPSPSSDGLGSLPQWRLEDLYESMDSPRFAADLERAEQEAKRFAAAWRGKLAATAASEGGGERLAEAVRAYEALQDLTGRVMSYASLLYASDTSDAARAKFYGDAHERVTALAGDLLFFELELNRIDDALLERAHGDARAWPLPPMARGHPQGEAASARRRHRAAVPGEVGIRRCCLESAVRRHHGGLAFRLRGREPDARTPARQASGSGRKEARRRRRMRSQRRWAPICASSPSSPTRSPRTRKSPTAGASSPMSPTRAISPIGSNARWSTPLSPPVTEAYPRLSHRYYTMKARWFGKERLAHWDRNAPLPEAPPRFYPWETARDTVLDAYAGFSPRMADIARRFFDDRWIDAPVRPGKAPGAFSHPTTPSAHPYVLVNYLGKPRDVMTLAHELGHGVHQVLAGAERRPDGADAADARRDRLGVRRDADLPRAARRRDRSGRAQVDAGGQGRGHAQHRGAPDRLLQVRAARPSRAPQGAN